MPYRSFANTLCPDGSRQVRWLLPYLLYVGAGSLAVVAIPPQSLSLFDLGFGFGPAIDAIVQNGLLPDATRLPAIPYFLALVARIWDNTTFALVLKNLLLQSLTFIVFFWMWKTSRRPLVVFVFLGFLLTFPQLVRHGFALIPEQGYLIPFLAFLTYGLLRVNSHNNVREVLPYAICCAGLFLVSSSVMLVTPWLCICFFLRTRRLAVLALFVGLLMTAMAGWGLMTLVTTGRFSVTSSLNGYEFWKGNNPHTLDYFPHRSLDAISHLAPARERGETEWEWNAECFRQGLSFVSDRPREAFLILAMRFYQVFLAVRAEDSPSWGTVRAPLKTIGVGYMCLLRVMLLGSLFYGVSVIWRAVRERGMRALWLERATEACVIYTGLIGSFVAPYLVAWGTERRLMPLVIPTVLVAWWWIEEGPGTALPEPWPEA